MVIIFLGSLINDSFIKTIRLILKKHLYFTEISENLISFREGEITIIFKNSWANINFPDAAVFLNRCSNLSCIKNEKYCICDSSNLSDLKMLKNSEGEVITCGLSRRDTLTFSSLTEDGCVISLQRNITRFNGKTAEPMDFPCQYTKNDNPYAVLSAHLILILLGKI